MIEPEKFMLMFYQWIRDVLATIPQNKELKPQHIAIDGKAVRAAAIKVGHQPMMLATNKEIKSKNDVIKVAKLYFSRWRIEEYFRSKKQLFQFENFRVRKLKAINALNFYLTLCMAFLGHISMKSETNALKVAIIQTADYNGSVVRSKKK